MPTPLLPFVKMGEYLISNRCWKGNNPGKMGVSGRCCELLARIASKGLAIISGNRASKLRLSAGKIEAKTAETCLTGWQEHGKIWTSKGDYRKKAFPASTVEAGREEGGVYVKERPD